MANEHVSQDAGWDFDAEIKQTEQLAEHWQNKAKLYEGTPSGELIKSIASGYTLHLAALREQCPTSSS